MAVGGAVTKLSNELCAIVGDRFGTDVAMLGQLRAILDFPGQVLFPFVRRELGSCDPNRLDG